MQQGRRSNIGLETLGVDLRTRRKKYNVRFSLIKKNKAFQKNYVKVVKKLSLAGMVPARTWRVHAVEMAPTERFKLRRQIAAAAGKKSSTSLSLLMEAFGLEVEEELSTMVTQTSAEGVWIGKWHTEPKETWLNQVLEVQMCETRDLGIKWPTLIFEGQVRVDMRYVCPKDVKKMLLQQGQVSLLEERVRRIEGGYLAGTGSGLNAKKRRRKIGVKSIVMLRRS